MFELRKIMDEGFSFVNKETHIYVAMNLLVKERAPGLPVVNENMCPIGILFENDVLKALTAEEITDNRVVSDYMSTSVRLFGVNDSAVDVCEFFLQNTRCGMVLIEDEGRLVGTVSRRDLVYLILKIRGKIYQKNK